MDKSTGSADQTFKTGAEELFADRYQLVEKIGSGGMGIVYKAQDVKLNESVALKFLDRPAIPGSLAYDQFIQEIKLARKISHPNVCRIFDIGDHRGQLFVSMALINGESLTALMERVGKLSSKQAIQIVRQLTDGLKAAHDQGIVHRDIKPANIMLDQLGQAILLDFGIARAYGEDGREASIMMGTPSHITPEMIEGKTISCASDIYSLGLVWYELITGERPFSGTTVELMQKHVLEVPRPPKVLNPEIPEAINRLILKMLEKNPSRRPKNASALSHELQSLEASTAVANTSDPDLRDDSSITMLLRERHRIEELLKARFRREISLLFSDIKGSTAYFEKMGDVAGRDMIRRHNDLLFPIIDRHHGNIIKTIGDAIMASFPHASDAVTAAIDMQRALYSERCTTDQSISIRIGINTGEALVEDNDLFGDMVNLAARIQSLANPDQILISRTTRDKTIEEKPELNAQQMGEVRIKGKQHRIELFQVQWTNADSTSRRWVNKTIFSGLSLGSWRIKVFLTAGCLSLVAVVPAVRHFVTQSSISFLFPQAEHSRIVARRSNLLRRLEQRGILVQDLTDLPQRLGELEAALTQGNRRTANRLLDGIEEAVERFTVDRPFIDQKLRRYNQLLSQIGNRLEEDNLFRQRQKQIMAAIANDDFSAANALLNQQFRQIASMQTTP